MRVLIERVTCDRCGQVCDFEKMNEASKTARIETLTEWLRQIGWLFSNGRSVGDFCPTCSGFVRIERKA